VKPVFISVDPRRDTVGQMKNYGQDFHPSIAYLTGTREQVAVAAKAYRVYFSKVCVIIRSHDIMAILRRNPPY
jgi:protein SCO1/2